MTDEKQKARSKILGELESIRSLLEDENGNMLDPPLLTDPLEDDEAPLLTITWETERPRSADAAQSTGPEESLEVEVDIPTLEADPDLDIPTLDPGPDAPLLDATAAPEVTSETDAIEPKSQIIDPEPEDIVTRALKAPPRPSLFDSPEVEPPTTVEIDDSHLESDAWTKEQGDEAQLRAEEQPGLFDVQPASEATKRHEAAHTAGQRDGAAPKKSENPFLPKHIRDRLSANRALQQELVKSFTSPPYTPFPPPARRTTHDNEVDQQLIDQLVQRYLPKIEAELREKLRAVLREERESSAKPEHD